MIAIIDYGVGNLFSLAGSLKKLDLDAVVTSDPSEIKKCDRIILPGVGAFGDAAEKLFNSGLADVILDEVKEGKPLMGICLGMQLLFEKSFEYGEHKGLGLIPGSVVPLDDVLKGSLKVPHIGWNALDVKKPDNPLMKYTKQGDYMYYVHSFYADTEPDYVLATSEYGFEVTGAVSKGNVYGTQFHPEKSGNDGLKILKAFSEI
ncbi:MAG: imidazole glycerol phosphate synthase subunit HisH [Clostridia bacterium]|nr:imidazole glycerol phosphate synthase subunit HisH [Clostridia bacterium]